MKRRYKLLVIIFISFILSVLIYFFVKKDNYIFVSIGDKRSFNNLSTYTYIDYLKDQYKDKFLLKEYYLNQDVADGLISLIENDYGRINYFLKNSKAITINITGYELNNYKTINNEIEQSYLNAIYNLINKIRKLNSNLYIINTINPNLSIINDNLKKYCKDIQIEYIDLSIIGVKNYVYINNLNYLNYRGNKYIADYIISKSSK